MCQSHSSLYCCLLRSLSLNAERSTNDSVQDERQQEEISNINCVSRGFVFTEIEGILQLETWDCGVACLLMIKRWLREKHSDDDDNLNDDETLDLLNRSHVLSNIRTESIWTSDLMWQLHLWNRKKKTSICAINPPSLTPTVTATSPSYDFDFVLASQQLMGVDETYRDLDFYQNYFEEDQCRVAHTFRELYKQQVPMVQTTTTTKQKSSKADTDGKDSLSLSTVIKIIRRDDCVAIVLLDNRVLTEKLSSSLHFGSTTIVEKNQNTFTSFASFLHHYDDNYHDNNSSGDDNGNDNGNGNGNGDGDDDDDTDNENQQYVGHYVVLCGISDDPRHLVTAKDYENDINNKKTKNNNSEEEHRTDFCFVLRNPAPSFSSYMFVTPYRFEASWRASGTDQDIIFIRNKRQLLQSS